MVQTNSMSTHAIIFWTVVGDGIVSWEDFASFIGNPPTLDKRSGSEAIEVIISCCYELTGYLLLQQAFAAFDKDQDGSEHKSFLIENVGKHEFCFNSSIFFDEFIRTDLLAAKTWLL